MMSSENKRSLRKDLLLAGVMVIGGLSMSVAALAEIDAHPQQLAQATPPLQSTPGAESKPSAPPAPSDSTTGSRPMTPAPQPAQPDADALKAGATPALPAAPAEKTAAPIQVK